jgi:hypothetical protein
MTRQCAWCERYLSFGTTGHVTHGICDQCAQHIRQSLQEEKKAAIPSSEEILLSRDSQVHDAVMVR